MDPSESPTNFSELEEADTASQNGTATRLNGNAVLSTPNHANGRTIRPSTRDSSSKYQHIAAVHLTTRNSCLSRDAESTPSFLGFRNLMVIVLSKCSPLRSTALAMYIPKVN